MIVYNISEVLLCKHARSSVLGVYRTQTCRNRLGCSSIFFPVITFCGSLLSRPICTPQMSPCTTTTRQCSILFTSCACSHGHDATQTDVFAQSNRKLQLPYSTKHPVQKCLAVQEHRHCWPQQFQQPYPCSFFNCPQW